MTSVRQRLKKREKEYESQTMIIKTQHLEPRPPPRRHTAHGTPHAANSKLFIAASDRNPRDQQTGRLRATTVVVVVDNSNKCERTLPEAKNDACLDKRVKNIR
uniref:SFRICE_031173 n=1 Tax=Spodoptera frugiperda TaxID=7108 RepID=A0A2H1W904_SPOFR